MAVIIGREPERKQLESLYGSGRSEFVVLYGRRRVGKTFLVRELFKDRMTFCHTGLSPFELKGERLMRSQLQNFSYSLVRAGKSLDTPPSDWIGAFNLLIEFLEDRDDGGRILVFLDEVPWMDTPRSGFLTALEHFWNGWGAGKDNLMLVVCGSATSWISNKLINNTGGLYGRITRRMRLEPMTLSETEKLLHMNGVTMERYDIVQSYMIFGGIPYYLNAFAPDMSLARNVDSLIFGHNSAFAGEFDRLFNSLFTNSDDYKRVVRFLAGRRQGYTREEISTGAMSSGGALTAVLDGLKESGFIMPTRDFSGRTRQLRYRLVDPFCLFYLHFVDGRKIADEAFWEHSQFLPSVTSWRGFAFENICFLHLPAIKAALGISGVSAEVSSWNYKGDEGHDGAQIDMLLKRADRVINLCEIKFSISEFSVNGEYDKRLKSRLQTFMDVVKPRSAVRQTLITTYGLRRNEYSGQFVDVVTMDDLFESR